MALGSFSWSMRGAVLYLPRHFWGAAPGPSVISKEAYKCQMSIPEMAVARGVGNAGPQFPSKARGGGDHLYRSPNLSLTPESLTISHLAPSGQKPVASFVCRPPCCPSHHLAPPLCSSSPRQQCSLLVIAERAKDAPLHFPLPRSPSNANWLSIMGSHAPLPALHCAWDPLLLSSLDLLPEWAELGCAWPSGSLCHREGFRNDKVGGLVLGCKEYKLS